MIIKRLINELKKQKPSPQDLQRPVEAGQAHSCSAGNDWSCLAMLPAVEIFKFSPMNYGQEIVRLRTKAGLTQYALAKAAKMSQQRLGMYENGSRNMPREAFIAVLRVLGYSLEEKIKKL